MITLDASAPTWAQRLKTSIMQELESLWTRPLPNFTVSTKPDPADPRWRYRLIFLTDGASNKWVATTNGVAWRYLDGNAV